jgi:hypothetical protein
VLPEHHPLGGKPVDAGCCKPGLSIAAQVAVTQVISKDINNIGRLFVPVRLAAGNDRKACAKSGGYKRFHYGRKVEGFKGL